MKKNIINSIFILFLGSLTISFTMIHQTVMGNRNIELGSNGGNNIDLACVDNYFFSVDENRESQNYFRDDTYTTYTINAIPNPAGWGSTTGSGAYSYGQTASLTALPNDGYGFVNWIENDSILSSDENLDIIVTEDRTIYANFEEVFHSIALSAEPPQAGTVAGGGSYLWGTEITISATPASTWDFMYWVEDEEVVSEEMDYTFVVNADRSLAARFMNDEYQITATVHPQNSGSLVGQGTYQYGDTVTMMAFSNQGWDFLYWAENNEPLTYNQIFTFAVEANRDFVAHFSREHCLVNALAEPLFGGSINGAGSFPCDETVTLFAISNTGYHFEKWTEDGEIISQKPELTFIPLTSRDLTAHFVNENYILLSEYSAASTPFAGFQELTVVADKAWLAAPDESWISVYPNYGGPGPTQVLVSWMDAQNEDDRQASVLFHNQWAEARFVVNQSIATSTIPDSEELVKVYPNPVHSLLNIKNIPAGSSVLFANVNGVAVKEIYQAEEQLRMDISQLPAGVYTLKVFTGNTTMVRKIIVFQDN